jgi:hypothetical protein
VSLGGVLYRVAMGALERAAKALAAGDMAGSAAGALPSRAFTGPFNRG